MESSIKSEREFEYYGFTIKHLKLEHQLLVKAVLKKCVNDFKEQLIEKFKDANVPKETLEKLEQDTFVNLTTKISDSLKPFTNEFNALTDELLGISENLQPLFNTKDEYVEADEEYLKTEIVGLEKMYYENVFLLNSMEHELEIYKKIDGAIEEETNLTENVEKSLAQLLENFGQNDQLVESVKIKPEK